MKRKMYFLVMIGMVVSLVLAGCAKPTPAPAPAPAPKPAPAPAPEKVYEMRFNTGIPATHLLTKTLYQPFIDTVNRESNGRIKATIYHGEVLAKHRAAYDAVLKGTIEIGQGPTMYWGEIFPLTDVMNTPYASPNSPIGTKIANGFMYDKWFSKEFAKVKMLNLQTTGSYNLFTKEPVRTLEDIKGMKTRVAGGMQVNIMNGFGAVPVALASAEMYEGLQKGLLDGTFFILSSGLPHKLYEVTNYLTLTEFSGIPITMFLSKEFYDGLPRDLQLVIEYAAKGMPEKGAYMYWDNDVKALATYEAEGMEVITLSAAEKQLFLDAAADAVEIWIEDREKKGIPAQQVYDDLMAQPELYGVK